MTVEEWIDKHEVLLRRSIRQALVRSARCAIDELELANRVARDDYDTMSNQYAALLAAKDSKHKEEVADLRNIIAQLMQQLLEKQAIVDDLTKYRDSSLHLIKANGNGTGGNE